MIALFACAPGEEGSTATVEAADPTDRVWFEERAAEAGLDFLHRTGAEGGFLFPETIGGGAALLDVDDDGFLDVFLVQSGWFDDRPREGATHRLFRNRGDATFEDITEASGVDREGYGMGVAAGDYDGDGRTDLYVTNVGTNVLLRNEGGGRFADVTEAAGVGGGAWSTAATFSDYDADGDLDLFVCNYVFWTLESDKACYEGSGRRTYCGPHSYNASSPDQLYRNDGSGIFTEVAAGVGMASSAGNGLGVVSADFDGDGRFDFFVANDRSEDQLWINQDGGQLQNKADVWGCAVDPGGMARAGMGVDVGDVDDDGDLDLIVVNLHGETDGFYRNEGRYFVEETSGAGIGLASRAFTRFGVGFEDFDNDGDLDLYQANGRVTLVGESYTEDAFAEPNLLLIRGENGKWSPSELQGGTAETLVHTSRAAAFGDLDNDGGVDVVVANSNARPYLLRNVREGRGHWILGSVVNERGAPAIGATCFAEVGGRRLRRDVLPGTSYASSCDPRVHFGLGEVTTLPAIEVRWPRGDVERFGPFEADQVVVLKRGQGESVQR